MVIKATQTGADPTGTNLTDYEVRQIDEKEPNLGVNYQVGARLQALRQAVDLDVVRATKFTVKAADIGAGGPATVELGTLSDVYDAYISECYFELAEVFAGGALATATASVGNDTATADVDAYVKAADVFTGASLTARRGFLTAEVGEDMDGTNAPILPAGDNVTVTFVGTGADPEVATTGELSVFVFWRPMPT